LKKLFEALIYCLRASLIDRLTMAATLRAASEKSKLLEDWEWRYKNQSLNPDAAIVKAVDAQLEPLQALLAGDWGEKGQQELLRQAQKLENHLRSHERQ